jgi:hypothetical protein
MATTDWDVVPQPLRAMAFIDMARYWSLYYGIGREYGLPAALVGDTLAAIVMVESWFEHRGVARNRDGTRDLGLGGASDYCRARLRQLHEAGVVDVAPSDDEYFNPFVASRVAAIWLRLMLDEAGGDLNRAIAAYHTGIAAADRDDATAYAVNVGRKRQRFIENDGAPAAWTFLVNHLGSEPNPTRALLDVGRHSAPVGSESRKRQAEAATEVRDAVEAHVQ